ncbi:hypothetical protein Bbelb_108270 [Branchiostoma belcheri]|nr:hypothetical protein Bbelb_108270 [Branchiostoma belcheri]
MNTYFTHQESHQYTWYRYNSRLGCYDQKSQIDFILTNKKTIIKDVKAIPSVSLDSDHRLVKGKVKIHLPKLEKKTARKRVKTENLEHVQSAIQEKLLKEKDNIKENNIETHWESLKTCLQEIQENIVGMTVVGKLRKKRTGWWTEEVKAEVASKNKCFKEWLKVRTVESRLAYVQQRNRANRTKKKAQKEMWENIGKDLEIDAQGTKKLLYSMSKAYKSRNDDKPRNSTLKDETGELITGQNKIIDRWIEYFQKLLNVEEEGQTFNDLPQQTTENAADMTETAITMEELEMALSLTKNNKTPGPDMIPIETIKAGGDTLKLMILNLLNHAWETGSVPEEWNQSVICPIYKNKGDPQDCKNYRGISLMSHVGKLYERILERRLRNRVESQLDESQCGFRPNRGTVDQIAALRLFLEKSWEHCIEQHVCFLDLEKAFDRVPRDKMWRVIAETGISAKLLRAIKSTYKNQKSTVLGGTTYFAINTGVRQGSVLSPLLFITYLNHVIIRIEREDFKAERFGYADDIAQTGNSLVRLQRIMGQWDQELSTAGLKLSYGKTEYMKVGRKREKRKITIKGHTLKQTTGFGYLGSKLSSNNLIDEEIDNRIAKKKPAEMVWARTENARGQGYKQDIQLETKEEKTTWQAKKEEVKNLTQDRVAWRNLTQRLTTDRPEGLQASG